MKRYDLLRSPLLLMAVGLLLLNDFVLKAAFHNWFTGKLSDFAGLAAFTIFWCAIWPQHVRMVGSGITVLFVFWKSPGSEGAIELANSLLPITIGRTADSSDLIALPVVWLICANSDRLPLVDIGKIGVWLTAGVCLFAFTATSQVPYGYVSTEVAAIPEPANPASTEASLQQLLDDVAARHGLRCSQCRPLAQGRTYGAGAVGIAAGFDADERRLVFSVSASASEGGAEKTKPERLKAIIEQELRARFPAISIGKWTAPPSAWVVVRLALPTNEDAYDQALGITEGVVRNAGLKITTAGDALSASSEEQVRMNPLHFAPLLSARVVSCRGSGSFVILVSSVAPVGALQQQILGGLTAGLGRSFGLENVSSGPLGGLSLGCGR